MIFVYSLLKKCRLFGNFSLDKTRQKEKRERYRRSPSLQTKCLQNKPFVKITKGH